MTITHDISPSREKVTVNSKLEIKELLKNTFGDEVYLAKESTDYKLVFLKDHMSHPDVINILNKYRLFVQLSLF
jgi:hypothetical protein